MALFADDRPAPELALEVVQVRLSELSLHHPRQFGGCWLALRLWEPLDLDGFWGEKLPPRRRPPLEKTLETAPGTAATEPQPG